MQNASNPQLKAAPLALSLIVALAALAAPLPLEEKAHRMLAIALFMASLWVGEAFPLHVTALLGTVLMIIFVPVGAKEAFASYFNPTIALFFGGLMLARAMGKHGLDRKLAFRMLAGFGNDPRMFLLGLMAVTAFLSFWISNTATAAIMLPIALFALVSAGGAKKDAGYAKSVVIGVAFAATIGGMATVVGTPPNAIAVAELADHGVAVPFFEWAWLALPFVVLLVPLAWLVLVAIYPPGIKRIELPRGKNGWDGRQLRVLAIGLAVVALWMTAAYHHLPDSAVSVMGVVGLYAAGLLGREDLGKIDWAVLLLVGGSMAMGAGIESSGLAGSIGGALATAVAGQDAFTLSLSIILFAVVVTSFTSNTSTAALTVPIVASLSLAMGSGLKEMAVLAGMSSSLNFMTPAGTPPSAMAYSSGYISVWDMMKPGVVITIIAVLLLAFLKWLYW